MRPKHRRFALTVPRHVADRALSWYKAQKHALGQSQEHAPAVFAHIKDINGRRWNMRLRDGVLLVWPHGQAHSEPYLTYWVKEGLVNLGRYEARDSNLGRRYFYVRYCNFGSLDDLYRLVGTRTRYKLRRVSKT